MLLVGVASAAVLGIAAGARRTDSAYPRFLASHARGDFLMGNGFVGLGQQIDLNAVARLPGVQTTGVGTYFPAVARTDAGRRILPGEAAVAAPADANFSIAIDRWKLLEGRRADPRRLDEAVASFEFARQFDVGVGSTIRLQFLTTATAARLFPQYLAGLTDRVSGHASPLDLDALWNGLSVTVRIVGIEAAQFEFPPRGTILPPLVMGRAFYKRYASELVREDFMHVKLHANASRSAFHAAVVRLAGGRNPPNYAESNSISRDVQRSIHLQAVVLWTLAALVGVSVVFILGQAFARQAYAEADDLPTLSALGMTRRQLVGLGMLRAAVISALGATLGIGIALAMSPIWPMGLARDADPRPGFAVDWIVLGVGAAALTAFAILAGGISTARVATDARRTRPRAVRQTRTASVVRHTGLPVSAALGIRHALESGRGRAAVPVRSAMIATALAVATIVVAATFHASTNHLLATRHLYGWVSDAEISTLSLPADPVVAGLTKNPAIAAVAAGTGVQLDVAGRTVNAVALDNVYRSVRPDLVEGHAPRHDNQIILGSRTLHDLGLGLGDHVLVRAGTETARMRVVGRALFSQTGDAKGYINQGAQITFAALRRLMPDTPATLVRYRLTPRADPATVNAQISAAVVPFPLHTPAPPKSITSFGRTNNLPEIVAAIMAIVAAAALAHTMVTSVRRRRRDFAILETLGCVRRQLSTTVATTATTFACIALLAGIPLGLIGGTWAWNAIANALGVPSEPTLSIAGITLVILGMLLAANVIALLPAALARRTNPATALHAE